MILVSPHLHGDETGTEHGLHSPVWQSCVQLWPHARGLLHGLPHVAMGSSHEARSPAGSAPHGQVETRAGEKGQMVVSGSRGWHGFLHECLPHCE